MKHQRHSYLIQKQDRNIHKTTLQTSFNLLTNLVYVEGIINTEYI